LSNDSCGRATYRLKGLVPGEERKVELNVNPQGKIIILLTYLSS